MRIALCAALSAEERLAAGALRHGHDVVARCSGADELANRLDSSGAQLAMVGASSQYLSARLVTACDDAGVRIVILASDETDRRAAAALGIVDVVASDSEWAAIESFLNSPILGAATEGRPQSVGVQVAGGSGKVIAVWGPAGAPGRTTLAVSIAAEIAAAGHSVVLADSDTHGGAVAPALGLLDEAPGFAAACRLAGAGSLSRTELERIGQRHPAGRGEMWVLTGIGRTNRWPELSTERVTGAIDACKQWVDYTVLDLGFSLENDEEISSDVFAPRRNAATIAGLQAADEVVAVGSADPVGLSRFLRTHVDLLETVTVDRVTVVMNRVRASAVGLNPAGQVTQTLARFAGIEHPVLVPFDAASCDRAILSGRTLVDSAPKSAARVAIRELVASRFLPASALKTRSVRRRRQADAALATP